jgi:SAM-dependent methyltransferase
MTKRDTPVGPSALLYPEVGAGGFSSVDGTVEFYARVNSLLAKHMVLLDFGAGRGKDAVDDPVEYRRALRNLRGKVGLVVGADIDPIVASNPSLDSAVIVGSQRLPFATASIDLILSDHTFEHVKDPARVAQELDRVVKPGGWICARTPNRWGYIAIGATIVPNKLHRAALRRLQPGRKPEDVFRTEYRLNTIRTVCRYFPKERYVHHTYYHNSEPAYFGNQLRANQAARTILRFAPTPLSATLMVFMRKRD